MRAEEDVKRLRKSEDVAQPGEVNPEESLPGSQRRRRGRNPMGGQFARSADAPRDVERLARIFGDESSTDDPSGASGSHGRTEQVKL
jgi:3,4-dihydroxy-2-butanone 4-phosphate synthase